MLHDQNGSAGEGCDVTGTPAPGEADQAAAPAGAGGVQVPERIDFRAADEAHVDPALLQQAHDVDQAEAGERPGNVGRIAHGVDERLGGPVADDAVLEQADRVGRVGCLGQPEAEQGKPHADEHDLLVSDFAGRRDHHQFSPGIGRRHGAKFAAAAGRRSVTRSRSRVASPICCRYACRSARSSTHSRNQAANPSGVRESRW